MTAKDKAPESLYREWAELVRREAGEIAAETEALCEEHGPEVEQAARLLAVPRC